MQRTAMESLTARFKAGAELPELPIFSVFCCWEWFFNWEKNFLSFFWRNESNFCYVTVDLSLVILVLLMIRIVPPYIVFRDDLMKPKYWTDMCSFAFLHQRGVGVWLRTPRSLLNMSFNPIFKCIPSRLIGVACGSRCGADYFCSCFIARSENSNIDFGSLICLVTGDIRLKSCLQSWLVSKICYKSNSAGEGEALFPRGGFFDLGLSRGRTAAARSSKRPPAAIRSERICFF